MIFSSAKDLAELPPALDQLGCVLELLFREAPMPDHDFAEAVARETRGRGHDEARLKRHRTPVLVGNAREHARALAEVQLLESFRYLLVHRGGVQPRKRGNELSDVYLQF